MTRRTERSDDAADVVRDARALTDLIKGRNLQVIQASVRPSVEVCFFAAGERDTITEFFLELADLLGSADLVACRVQDSVLLTATGLYKKVLLSIKLYAPKYEARLLDRELEGLSGVKDHKDVPTSREALQAAVALMSEHADDCDLTCQQYGQIPCYADRAL
jgi:hypothetical protein